jgi:anti-anti-sigma factor
MSHGRTVGCTAISHGPHRTGDETMDVVVKSDDGNVVQIEVAGKVSHRQIATDADLLSTLAGPDVYSKTVLLNLAGAEFLDSSGVGWLLMCHRRFEQNGGRMVLCRAPAIVMNVLKVLRMHLVFNLADSEVDALRQAQGETS